MLWILSKARNYSSSEERKIKRETESAMNLPFFSVSVRFLCSMPEKREEEEEKSAIAETKTNTENQN